MVPVGSLRLLAAQDRSPVVAVLKQKANRRGRERYRFSLPLPWGEKARRQPLLRSFAPFQDDIPNLHGFASCENADAIDPPARAEDGFQ
eukprot:4922897-Alexandrium_andersonii.AAC.1